ncbi:hypothetical protein [Cellulomonas rhizosphaerae]|uniref:HTH araC/xylS-type domain-containing protein n=1 Tax=Cellulomonas rhizosphaerae TaxID=2293719 RepID=A0A413RNT2_9CELL|nr:hypothetical protein [Cellulomonas rhizosphaerae]RHA43560.1 hypothetical protein D1825_05730 [Cellulomonas rhizosphaerae]
MPVDQVQYTRIDVEVPGLVEHAWVVVGGGPSREILLPDGRGLLQVVLEGDGSLVDTLTGASTPDATGVRGLMTRPVVRVQDGSGVRLGIQLAPSALAAVGAPGLVDAWGDAEGLVGPALGRASDELAAGRFAAAAHELVDALVARRVEPTLDAVRFGEVLRLVDERAGLVSAQELARAEGVTVSDLHRWTLLFLGAQPADYLAAVRFASFVRQAVGPGVARPDAVLQALSWYSRAEVPPREVERSTGLDPVELRRVEERIAALVGPATV